jgi:hypothetical protein
VLICVGRIVDGEVVVGMGVVDAGCTSAVLATAGFLPPAAVTRLLCGVEGEDDELGAPGGACPRDGAAEPERPATVTRMTPVGDVDAAASEGSVVLMTWAAARC